MSLKLLPTAHAPHSLPASPHTPHPHSHSHSHSRSCSHQGQERRRYGPYLRPSDSCAQLAALVSLVASSSSSSSSSSHSNSASPTESSVGKSMSSAARPSQPLRRPSHTHARAPSATRLRLPLPLPAPRIPPTLVNSPHLHPSSGSAFRQHRTLSELSRVGGGGAADRDDWGIGDMVPMPMSPGLPSLGGVNGRPGVPQRAKSDSYVRPQPAVRAPPVQPLYTPQPSTSPFFNSLPTAHHPPSASVGETENDTLLGAPTLKPPHPAATNVHCPAHTRTGSTVFSHSRLGPDSPSGVEAEEEMREYFQSRAGPLAAGHAGNTGKEKKEERERRGRTP